MTKYDRHEYFIILQIYWWYSIWMYIHGILYKKINGHIFNKIINEINNKQKIYTYKIYNSQ